jgi:hypothetical protein
MYLCIVKWQKGAWKKQLCLTHMLPINRRWVLDVTRIRWIWRTSRKCYAQSLRYDVRRNVARVSCKMVARTCRARSAQQGMLLLDHTLSFWQYYWFDMAQRYRSPCRSLFLSRGMSIPLNLSDLLSSVLQSVPHLMTSEKEICIMRTSFSW